jgi:hypothetical protein
MKPSESFKKVISDKMNEMASADPAFAEKMKAEGKSIDLCITYILNTVQKSGSNGFTDDEVFGMAAHYYDEEKIEVGKPINCNVVVNHSVEKVELSAEDLQTAKEKAMETAIAEERERLRKKAAPKKTEASSVNQGSLF